MDAIIYKMMLTEWMSSIGGGPPVALVDFGYAVEAAAGAVKEGIWGTSQDTANMVYHWESLQSGVQKIADMPAAELEAWVAEAATRRYQ